MLGKPASILVWADSDITVVRVVIRRKPRIRIG